MDSHRKTAIIVGVLFIAATAFAIIGLTLEEPVVNDPAYIINGSTNQNQVILGELFWLIEGFAVIGTAIMLFPYLKKQNESIALGYVAFRLLEAVLTIVAIISLLSIVSLSQEFVTAPAPSVSYFMGLGTLLLAVHGWAFLIGTYFVLGIDTLMWSYLLYRSKLIPRPLAVWGLIAAVSMFSGGLLQLFGLTVEGSVVNNILIIPVATVEMALAVWLIVKGFNSSAIASLFAKADKLGK